MYQHLSFAMFHHISRHSSVLDTLCELSFSMFIGSSNPDKNKNILKNSVSTHQIKKKLKCSRTAQVFGLRLSSCYSLYFTLIQQPIYHLSFCGNLLASSTLDVHLYYPQFLVWPPTLLREIKWAGRMIRSFMTLYTQQTCHTLAQDTKEVFS